MPLIERVSTTNYTPQTGHRIPHILPSKLDAKHIWFADDSAAGGKLCEVMQWWSNLQEQGPSFGYFPKPSKTWLIVKEEHLERAKAMFSGINITTEGHRYLGSYIGTDSGKIKFMQGKATDWLDELDGLISIASK